MASDAPNREGARPRRSAGGRFVALLRGVNVGKARRIGMADLRGAVESAGFTDVRTVLASGNLVLSGARAHPDVVARAIERALVDRLGVAARATVLEADAYRVVVAENPLGEGATDPARHLVAFLRDRAAAGSALAPLLRERWAPEALALGTHAAYLWCADGILRSPLLTAVARRLGDDTTTRNWATVGKVEAVL